MSNTLLANRTLWALVWFLYQCSSVGGLGAIYFWVPTIIILGFLSACFRRSPAAGKRRFWWLAILPACWILVGLWGGYYWREPYSSPNPPWVLWPVNFGLWVYLALAAALIVYMRRGRTFAVLFAAFNLYLKLGITLLAGMAVTNNWL
jgi:hypothetical protein